MSTSLNIKYLTEEQINHWLSEWTYIQIDKSPGKTEMNCQYYRPDMLPDLHVVINRSRATIRELVMEGMKQVEITGNTYCVGITDHRKKKGK